MQDAFFVVCISLVLAGSLGTGGIAQAAGQDTPADANAVIVQTATEDEARPQIIKSIEFEGNKKFADHVLRQRLGFELGDRLDTFLAEGGRLTIVEVYRKIGYVSVEASLDRTRLSDGHLFYRINEGPRVRVASVRFVGNKAMSDGTLRSVVKTKDRNWLIWPHYYTEDAIEEDADRLRVFYHDRGYLDYKVEASVEFSEDRSKVHVTFTIDEGPAFRIGQIVVTGNTHFTEEQLREDMESREGQVYKQARAQRDATAIARRYREQGFVDAEVVQQTRFTGEVGSNVITLAFEIVEGDRFRIGRIDVTGNETTHESVIRNVLDEYEFTPGNWYDARLAPKEGGGLLETYVQRRAVAQSAIVRPVTPADGSTERKDMRVDIEEGPTGILEPSIGISSDSGVIGIISLRQQNFDITDWPESLGELLTMKAFRGAGQRLNLTLAPGTEYSQYFVNFVDPYWRDKPVSLDVLGRSWKRYRESHDEKRLKASVGFEQRLEGRWRRSIAFRGENVDVRSLDYDAPQEIIDVKGETQLFGVRFGIGETTVSNPYNPSDGHTVDLGYEQVTGDDGFGVLEGSYVRYFTLYEDVLERRTVLAGKLLGATILGDAPPFEKFYGGGTSRYGIRGFEYRGVSTRGLQTNVADPQYKDPIGSDWIFLANAQISVPVFSENFAWLFFVDSGTIDTGSYRLSIGTGVQIMVPQVLGPTPMRFELATPLLRDDDDETQVFSFTMSGMFF